MGKPAFKVAASYGTMRRMAPKNYASGNPGIEMPKPGPWKSWFAWYPVKTVSGRRYWGCIVYRRRKPTLFRRYASYEYGDDFDILSQ